MIETNVEIRAVEIRVSLIDEPCCVRPVSDSIYVGGKMGVSILVQSGFETTDHTLCLQSPVTLLWRPVQSSHHRIGGALDHQQMTDTNLAPHCGISVDAKVDTDQARQDKT